MKTFPMFLKMTGRRVVVVGGTEEALRKVRLVQRTEAEIVVIADDLHPELAALRDAGRISVASAPATPMLFDGAALAFIATADGETDRMLAGMARAAGVPVNVVDRPDLCDAFTPSIVDRDPLVVAIGTEGTAPVLGRGIRAQIEAMLEPWLGSLARLAGDFRPEAEAELPKPARRAFWEWVFAGPPRAAFARGDRDAAVAQMRAALAMGGAPQAGEGSISLVGAGPGAGDLLTLRAQKRLNEADVIFHDAFVGTDVLDLARRDAERVRVTRGQADSLSQDALNAAMIAAAHEGKRVVRLKTGDPGVFSRACQEIDAARAAGIPVEIVPGVSAAVAAGASLGMSLTERGRGDRLVLVSAASRRGQDRQDWAAMLTPGTTLAVYMAVPLAAELQDALLSAGFPADLPIDAVSDASLPTERHMRFMLGTLDEQMRAARPGMATVLLIRHPSAG